MCVPTCAFSHFPDPQWFGMVGQFVSQEVGLDFPDIINAEYFQLTQTSRYICEWDV